MGIPHLISYLQPYATPTILGDESAARTEKDSPPQPRVIDGPALAYHIYHVCLAKRQDARNALEATPSYEEIIYCTVRWLNKLRNKYGVEFKNIYFDGFLPPSKRDVRRSRLLGYYEQLVKFHKFNPRGVPNIPIPIETNTPLETSSSHDELLVVRPTPSKLTALPAPPFLVPVVIYALLECSSYYDEIVEVVPGEADQYCAAMRDHMVFTSDSDLLVHDLGHKGSVVLFKDIEENMFFDGRPVLQALVYQPHLIAERLKIQSIAVLACAMRKDPTLGFKAALAQAKKFLSNKSSRDSYFEFLREYIISKPTKTNLLNSKMIRPSLRKGLHIMLRKMDPRVSEFVHQCGSQDESSQEPNFYLPFLICNPTRASPWAIGSALRTLGYSLLHRALVPKEEVIMQVLEFVQGGQGITIAEVEPMSESATKTACRRYNTLFRALLAQFSGYITEISDLDFWKIFGLHQILTGYRDSGKELPQQSQLKQLVANPCSQTQDWAMIHLIAQFQAVLYSASILRQIMWVCHFLDIIEYIDFIGPFGDLSSDLEKMQPYDHLFAFPKDLPQDIKESERWDEILSKLFEFLHVQESPVEASQGLPTAEMKKRKRAESHANPAAQPADPPPAGTFGVLKDVPWGIQAVQPANAPSNNMFGILRFD